MNAPVATACPTCEGARVVAALGIDPYLRPASYLVSCPACCCHVCGQPTDTPPECARCFQRADDRAVRRADT